MVLWSLQVGFVRQAMAEVVYEEQSKMQLQVPYASKYLNPGPTRTERYLLPGIKKSNLLLTVADFKKTAGQINF